MKTAENALTILRQELEFLNQGGYRKPIGSRQPLFCMETSVEWRQPSFFEDSPSCPKERYCPCNPEGDCVLLGFVPTEHRLEAVPCRHIPLNEKGETVDSLNQASTQEKIEGTLRNWLVTTIDKLQSAKS